MKVCVVSFKECWRDASGAWMTDGGFPRQMTAIASLFDGMVIVTPEVPARRGGIPLPMRARVAPLKCPAGVDARRKLSILAGLSGHLRTMTPEIRRADVLHVPLPGDLPFIGMVLAQAYRKPLLARYGSSWTVNSETTLMNRLTKRWMRLTAGGRNVMVATGQDDEPPARGMHWLFASAMWSRELDELRGCLDRPLSRPPRLVYAGRLAPEKGLPVLIRAFARLYADAGMNHDRKADTNVDTNAADRGLPTLTLAGDGPDRAALEAEARRLLPDGVVTFLGQLDRDGLTRCLRDADVCVHPSLTESLCKAWLDAMAHGLPVIAADVGAARAAIGEPGERGLLVRAGDPAAFAAAIRQLLDEPRDWPALRHRCHAFVQSRTLETWAERLGQFCASQWGLSFVNGKLARPR
jgi:glycosyltransferase involved in cell wall biosynthesis